MAVVTVRQLNRYMSSPKWSEVQQQTAEDVLGQVEASLAASLDGAVITPREVTETASVTGRGIVSTSLPVYRLLAIGDQILGLPDSDPAADLPLPAGYALNSRGLLRNTVLAAQGRVIEAGVLSSFAATGSIVALDTGIALHYLGGWGPHPSLVGAILRKAAAIMGNRHSDTMGVSGLAAESPAQKPAPEEWTGGELAALGPFRNLGRGGG